MLTYKEILLNNIKYSLIYLIIFIIAVTLFVRGINEVIKLRNGKYKKGERGKAYLAIVYCVGIALFLVLVTGGDMVISVKMCSDYINDSFNTSQGFIIDVNKNNSIQGTNIIINNDKFYLGCGNVSELRNQIGYYCIVVYGSKSKLVVDYEVVNKPLDNYE